MLRPEEPREQVDLPLCRQLMRVFTRRLEKGR